MWFKNVIVYKLHDATAAIPRDLLEATLQAQSSRTTDGGSEARRIGWTAPAGRGSDILHHELQSHRLMTAMRQERILPPSVVREEVDERVADIEAQECRKLRRQEKQAIKEQVYEELLPRAFVRTQRTDLWWDTQRQLIAIATPSRKRAEEVLDLLRESLGSLKVTPLATQSLPIRAMTTWLVDPASRPADMVIGDQAELKAKGDDGVIRSRQVDLDSDDMQRLLECGRQASKLALGLEGKIRFVLHDDMAIKAITFDDALIDEANQADDGDDAVARLETDFLLMVQALGTSIDRLVEWMGGEADASIARAVQDHSSPSEDYDSLLSDVRAFVIEQRKASVSGIQRQFKLGYNRAARLIEALESTGVVSAMDTHGTRKVLVGVA